MWKHLKNFLGLNALDYAVPAHANKFWYSLGGLTLFSFVITIASGVILTQFYNPTPTVAHASVRYIMQTPGIAFVRALHHWSAHLGFVLLIAHLLRVLLTGAFRPPRTVSYLVGLLLLFAAFQAFFTGTVLKWDQEGYEALAHFVAVNQFLGPLGSVFQEDFTLSTSMLARFYGLHIGVLPLLLVILAVVHGLYVKHFGIAPKPFQSEAAYQASLSQGVTFLSHAVRLAGYGLILLLILLGLAYLFPPGLLQPPEPGIEVTKPPWPFWIFYPIESLMGIKGILLGSVVLGFGLLLIPVLGVVIRQEGKLLRLVRFLTLVGFLGWVALLVITYFSPVMKHM